MFSRDRYAGESSGRDKLLSHSTWAYEGQDLSRESCASSTSSATFFQVRASQAWPGLLTPSAVTAIFSCFATVCDAVFNASSTLSLEDPPPVAKKGRPPPPPPKTFEASETIWPALTPALTASSPAAATTSTRSDTSDITATILGSDSLSRLATSTASIPLLSAIFDSTSLSVP